MVKPPFLAFKKLTKAPKAKTNRWRVESKITRVEVGLVKWHSPWRRYVLRFIGEPHFDHVCLLEAADFCKRMTDLRKLTWKHSRQEAANDAPTRP